MVPWSSGQDVALSRQNQGFDSPWDYQKNKNECILTFVFLRLAIVFQSPTQHPGFAIKKEKIEHSNSIF